MIKVRLAVGVGYEFMVVSSDLVRDIRLVRTNQLVLVNGETYSLYKGLEYEDSTKIDNLMDGPTHPKIYKIAEHLV